MKHLQKIIFSSVLLCLCLNVHTAYAQDVKRVPIEGDAISSMASIDLNDMKQRIEKLEKHNKRREELLEQLIKLDPIRVDTNTTNETWMLLDDKQSSSSGCMLFLSLFVGIGFSS